MEWICGNGIAKIGGKKNLLQLVCGKAIAEIGGKKFVAIVATIPLYFFFFLRNDMCTQFLQYFYKKI